MTGGRRTDTRKSSWVKQSCININMLAKEVVEVKQVARKETDININTSKDTILKTNFTPGASSQPSKPRYQAKLTGLLKHQPKVDTIKIKSAKKSTLKKNQTRKVESEKGGKKKSSGGGGEKVNLLQEKSWKSAEMYF